jgi:hypothetical protein
MTDADPFPPKRSPDGRIEVQFSAYEVRMSHWVLEPLVFRTRDDRLVVSLEGSGWDGGGVKPEFPRRHRVMLRLRRYPGGEPTLDVVVDVEKDTWWFAERPDSAAGIDSLTDELERAFERRVAETAPDYLAQGLCPYCKAQLYPRRGLGRLLFGQRQVQCLVCERLWDLPA